MTQEEKVKAYDEALERFHQFKEKYYRKETHFGDVLFDKTGEMQKDFDSIFPQLAESEDEKIRKKLIEIVGYFRSRGIDQQLCEKFLDYLEKQKEPHYTKRNALFDKCVENCDPEVMKEVSNKIDEVLGKEQKPVECELEDAFKYYTDAGITVSCGDIVAKPKEQEQQDENLDEAARDYGVRGNANGVGGEDYAHDLAIAFKAGAEWMKEQLTVK